MRLRARLLTTVALAAVPLTAGALWLRQRVELEAAVQSLDDLAEWIVDDRAAEHLRLDPATWPPRRNGPLGSGPANGGPRRPGGPAAPGRPGPRRDEGRPRIGGERPSEGAVDGRAAGDGRGTGDARGPRPEGPQAPNLWAYDADFTSRNPAAPAFPPELREALAAGDARATRIVTLEGREALELARPLDLDLDDARFLLITRPGDVPHWLDPAALWSVGLLLGGVLAVVWLAAGPLVVRTRRLAREVREAAGTHYEHGVPVHGRDELAELAEAFNDAGGELHAALERTARREQALRRFIENTSHDVGTPLTVLQGHLDALGSTEPGAATARRELEGAVDEAQHIGALLGNLSAVAQLEDPEMPVRHDRLELGALVQRVVDRHRPLARRRGARLEAVLPCEPVEALGDVTLLERALGNLVQNALRHGATADGTPAEVAVVLEFRADRAAYRLRVLDRGPGVPEAELRALTERRWRSDEARRRDPDGQGLGLAIVRDVADRHGLHFELCPGPEGVGLEASLEGPVAPA